MSTNADHMRFDKMRISHNHWNTLKHVYLSLVEEISTKHLSTCSSPLKLLQKFTGIGKNRAIEVVRLCNEQELPDLSTPIGRPKKAISSDHLQSVREFAGKSNAEGTVVITASAKDHLEDTEYEESNATISRDFKRMGFKYRKGNHFNILHDSAANVQYRETYLNKRLSNLNTRDLPVQPEVFLDESYCHLGHISKKTWFETGDTIRETGRKPMVVIFETSIVFSQYQKLCSEFVEESVLIWSIQCVN